MRVFKIKYLLVFSILFIVHKSFCQNFIGAKAFVKNNKVYLRWIPSDMNTLQYCLKEGFIIKRITWSGQGLPDTNQFRGTSFSKQIKALGATELVWKNKLEKNIENGFLYNVLYKTNTKNAKNENYFFGLAMLACDQDTSMAKAAGLFYIDEEVNKENLAYLILSNSPAKKIKPAIVIVNAAIDNYLPNPDSLKVKVYKKEIRLIWPEEKYKSFYTGYFIERSEDGINFKVLNKKPHVQIKTRDDKTKMDITFFDSTGSYNTQYYFRVRGLNFFGASSMYSNVVKAKIIKPINATVFLDSSKIYKDSLQKIYWHLAGKLNEAELAGFRIYKSINESGPYFKINNSLIKNQNYFIDEKPLTRTYYKVAAFNVYGDSSLSFSIMAMLPDINPPLPPKNFKGIIDSTGAVNLFWSSNRELDLKGYRVFRCNSINEEQVEITTKIIRDTTFYDKIDLNSLTENVVYYLSAVDNVFNNSKYTLPLILKRPDKIKPVAVIFTSLAHCDSSVQIKWINSSSKDVSLYELFQINQKGDIKKIKTWQAKDTLCSYIDYDVEYDNYYSYKIIVRDYDKNFSENLSAKHYFSSRVRKPMTSFTGSINKETKTILLEWKAPGSDVFSYVLYKTKKGKEFVSYKTFKANILKFEDKDLSIGNIYLYKIKANLNSGAETILSKELSVEF